MRKRSRSQEWQVSFEFVRFDSIAARDRAYRLWCDSVREVMFGSTGVPPMDAADRSTKSESHRHASEMDNSASPNATLKRDVSADEQSDGETDMARKRQENESAGSTLRLKGPAAPEGMK